MKSLLVGVGCMATAALAMGPWVIRENTTGNYVVLRSTEGSTTKYSAGLSTEFPTDPFVFYQGRISYTQGSQLLYAAVDSTNLPLMTFTTDYPGANSPQFDYNDHKEVTIDNSTSFHVCGQGNDKVIVHFARDDVMPSSLPCTATRLNVAFPRPF